MAQPDVVIGLDIGTTSTIAAAVSLPTESSRWPVVP